MTLLWNTPVVKEVYSKICARCKERKESDDFRYSKEMADGHSSYCKKCMLEKSKLYRKEHPGWESALKRKHAYGLAREQWDKLFEAQGKKCEICNINTPGGRGWQTDHDHVTGKTRGILCMNCNHILRKTTTIEILENAIKYLRKYK